jgi:hypothetical protein
MSDEYIKRWAEKLMEYKTEESNSIQDVRSEIEYIIMRHLREVCGDIDEDELRVYRDFDEEYFPEFNFIVPCGNKKVYIIVHVYGTVYAQIVYVDVVDKDS